jgi:8-oxo-dGTP pyrophosphatase MutT (NUDIX family)
VSGRFQVIVCFLIERDRQVLLLKRTMSKMSAGPVETGSGRVEQGESAIQAVLREARKKPAWMSRSWNRSTPSTSIEADA